MAINTDGEWDGVCACGRAAMDGVRCRLGATHEPHQPQEQKSMLIMPWEEKSMLIVSGFPWQTS